MIKLIAFDLDDTLLNSKNEINDLDKVALIELVNKGVNIVFCSGRPNSKVINKYYNDLGIENGYYIGFNGEAIYDIKNKKCVYQDYLNSNDLAYIVSKTKFISNYENVATYIYHESNNTHTSSVYTTLINKYVHIEDENNDIKIFLTNDLVSFNNAHKFMIASDPNTIKKIYNKLPKELFDKYTICTSMPCFIEFFKKNNNKYNGLLKVMEIYGIKENEVMTFGDSMNDYDLVSKAYIGVAMGNACQEIKECSKFVTFDNNSNGITNAIKHFEKEFKK